ncbi:hypothetical protein K435DRAFT_777671 [Dendrothele bispora CBS 962.96]|uniref:Uncharacterized protein n=1 Tax=Dendrothele bispora (strain CBS 962.96) TaxID=1314807 RepID=A0A4S8M6Z5_DENBC|nr:hypothetical protein K435DRAFT_777668 [Dendrothele bispora CBS 962.96]THU98069.1 hypothetical protein K435DRAFT_777671 [Dendrothele bispora CBS 962.96]
MAKRAPPPDTDRNVTATESHRAKVQPLLHLSRMPRWYRVLRLSQLELRRVPSSPVTRPNTQLTCNKTVQLIYHSRVHAPHNAPVTPNEGVGNGYPGEGFTVSQEERMVCKYWHRHRPTGLVVMSSDFTLVTNVQH